MYRNYENFEIFSFFGISSLIINKSTPSLCHWIQNFIISHVISRKKIHFIYTEKKSSVKFIELFKNWGYVHSRNRVLKNVQKFSEQNAELTMIFPELKAFYSEKLYRFSTPWIRNCEKPLFRMLFGNSLVNQQILLLVSIFHWLTSEFTSWNQVDSTDFYVKNL